MRGIPLGDELWITLSASQSSGSLSPSIRSLLKSSGRVNLNGAGCRIDYSTKQMGEPGGIQAIKEAIEKVEKVGHKLDITVYREDNEQRLTGGHGVISLTPPRVLRTVAHPFVFPDSEKGYG